MDFLEDLAQVDPALDSRGATLVLVAVEVVSTEDGEVAVRELSISSRNFIPLNWS